MSVKTKNVIGEKEVANAVKVLLEYKSGKQTLEERIVDEEKWWKLRHWESSNNSGGSSDRVKPTSAWLFNSIANKHADAMDNYPEPNVLPRERQDEETAKTLSAVLPVIVERNNFEAVYSDAWWYKLKHGTVCYGVFWDSSLENGLGDIKISQIDILNVFWKPGIKNIQDTPHLFIVSFAEEEQLKNLYPQLADKSIGKVIDVKEYVHDDNIDRSKQAVVVDWYYKKTMPDGRTLLHYCKFAGNTVLYASENDPNCQSGWYEHGRYPVEFDVLYPEAETPAGFGQISISRDPQMYIDKLNQLLLENAAMKCRPRYFVSEGSGINEEELLDISKTLIHIQGSLSDERLRKFEVDDLPVNVFNLLTAKIDELKETSSNRDVSQGSSSSGITSGAAIAALQEAGNKTSRDMILASYRTYTNLMYLVIELIRQFYTDSRTFRITGEKGQTDYAEINQKQLVQITNAGKMRKPIFDVVIKPQKRSAYSKLSQNELAKEMYNMGFFNPQNAEAALAAIDMMDFDGKQKVRDTVEKGQTLMMQIQEMQQRMAKMSEIIERVTGTKLADGSGEVLTPQVQSGKISSSADKTYGERLVENARANAMGVE